MKKTLAIILISLTFILAGCSKDVQTSDGSDDKKKESKNTIVWALPEEYDEDSELQDHVAFLNEELKKDGYDFAVTFEYISGEGQEYYENIMGVLESGDVDIAFLGLDGIGEAVRPAIKLIQSGALLPLDDYLQSEEGKKLQGAFYDKVWDAVRIDGKISAIPNQYRTIGTRCAAFNKKIYKNNIAFDGSLEDMETILKKADLPDGTPAVLWDMSFFDICQQLGYVYEEGVVIDIKTGEVSCPFETKKIVDYFKLLHQWNKEKKLVIPKDEDKKKKMVSDMNFAVWFGADRNGLLESVKEEVELVQLPYSFNTSISGCTGINKKSDKQKDALQLLSLLYTDSEYGNLLIHGKKDETYQVKDGYVCDMEGNALSSLSKSLLTGIFDHIYPSEGDDFPVDRKQTKWSLYDTPAMQDSVLTGFVPDVSGFDRDMLKLQDTAMEYEEVWKKKDLASALAEAVKACDASGSKRVEEELTKQIKAWQRK